MSDTDTKYNKFIKGFSPSPEEVWAQVQEELKDELKALEDTAFIDDEVLKIVLD